MHYHVVLTVGGEEDFTGTFDLRENAEEAAESISRQRDDWVPRRYPGRSWRAGEVAVYLDRRSGGAVSRTELAIIRYDVDGREDWERCEVCERLAAAGASNASPEDAVVPSSIVYAPRMARAMAAHLAMR